MTLHKERRIGRLSVLLLLNEAEERTQVEELERDGWKVCLGKVGSMDAHKVSFNLRAIASHMRFIMRRWRLCMA
jgi:hypothetical protein